MDILVGTSTYKMYWVWTVHVVNFLYPIMVEFVADLPPSRSELYFTPILMSDIKRLNWKKLLVNMHDDTIGFAVESNNNCDWSATVGS
jgi:hypothetical protein